MLACTSHTAECMEATTTQYYCITHRSDHRSASGCCSAHCIGVSVDVARRYTTARMPAGVNKWNEGGGGMSQASSRPTPLVHAPLRPCVCTHACHLRAPTPQCKTGGKALCPVRASPGRGGEDAAVRAAEPCRCGMCSSQRGISFKRRRRHCTSISSSPHNTIWAFALQLWYVKVSVQTWARAHRRPTTKA